jgi:hypothetical protein
MKKALVVLLVLTCLSAAAFADMAARPAITYGGEITYGFIGNQNNTADGWPNGEINLTLPIDANNYVYMGVAGWQTLPRFSTGAGTSTENGNTTGPWDAAYLQDFYGRTDIGGVMGVDKMMADPVLYVGFGVYDLPGYGVTEYGNERVAAIGIDNGAADGIFGNEAGSGYGLVALDTKIMGMVNVVLAASGTAFTQANQQSLVGLYGGVGPVSFEAGWALWNSNKGYVPVGLQYAATMGDIGLTVMANARLDMNPAAHSVVGAGAKVTYQIFRVDAAIITYYNAANSMTAKLTGDLEAAFTPNVGIVISPYFNFNSQAKDAFDTLEAFLKLTFGAANVKIGYLYMAGDVTDLNAGPDYAPNSNINQGGIFLLTDFNF